jgi:deoxyribodipyrimidine photo-lyase
MEQPNFTTNYNTIIERVQAINPISYAATRNFINGAVTYLSPYISRGVISLAQVQQAVLQKGLPYKQTEKLLQELAWREYYQRVWQVKQAQIWEDLKHNQQNVLHTNIPTSIINACTGINAVDEGIKKLFTTGYMHNHIRMYMASITCNIAKAYWLQPATWLYYYLLDGDIASNNCSWQWVAGAFASKKYYCNQENINKYTLCNQQHSFLDASYDILPTMPIPDALQETTTPNLTTVLPVTALPIIDNTKPTLIYNSYNIDPIWRSNLDANRILLLEPEHFKKYPVSPMVLQFIINLSTNIKGIQIYCGTIEDINNLYANSPINTSNALIYKEHPLNLHYVGIKDERDWMYPKLTGYYNSFFSYWKKCEKFNVR